ncbi:MAG: gamma-glutamyltransferase [Gemmatimonadaceae bacterium]|nr:gamma-glutamyltransferase [Gemmatimonadaceae bacterium]
MRLRVLFALLTATAALADAQVTDSLALRGARHPARSTANVLVFDRDGQLYALASGATEATRISRGSAWHRDAAFAGAVLYYASDSLGNYDLWRVTLDARGMASSAPERLTTSPLHDVSPSPLADGRVVFQRGLGGDARLWVREADGREHRLGTMEQNERRPRVNRDGTRVAYLVITETGRKAVVRPFSGGGEQVLSTEGSLEDVAWAPDGRVALSTRTGVLIVPTDGAPYANLASRMHGDLDWSPDGATLTIAEFTETAVAYNGDPDRGVDRSISERGSATTRVYALPAPPAPDARRATLTSAVSTDRSAANAAAFDRVWNRSDRLYFSAPGAEARRTAWQAVRDRLRPQAVAAGSDSALQEVIHTALTQRPPLREAATGRAAVSSAHPVATEAGLEIFRKGGNVVDAAVAVSFALGVVEPDASGVGGYGEMVIALKNQRPTLIEFMSRVPEEGGLSNTSLLQNGRYPNDGPVLVNVPGTVHGMYTAWQRHGSKKVAWADLVAPAIRAARNGYIVSQGLATTLATEREHFAKYEGSRALFFTNGQPKVAGDTVKNPDLAWVLEQIAAKGADGFYKGDVAKKYAGDLRAKGNAMKVSDLERYFANEREPVCGTYRSYRLCSSAPPVSGGAELVARLNLLERFTTPKLYRDDAATMHAALSAWFLVPSSRNKIADPALWPVDVASIVHKDTAAVRWRCYDADKALTPASVRGDTLPCLAAKRDSAKPASGSSRDATDAQEAHAPCGDDHAAEVTFCHAAGTTAFTVADADGNAVAVTQTLGTWGGNFYVTPGLGFLSNDKLTSYGTDPTQYGSRLPFARHGSTLAPTIAFKGNRPVFAVGAAGNAWITSAVYQTLLGALDYGLGPQAALEQPRFLPGGGFGGGAATAGRAQPYSIQLEDGFAPSVIARLRALGYDLSFVSARGEVREGYGAAVKIDAKSVTAGADPRRAGAAGAVRK